jgi:large-conductance mechanosensitive channel
MTAFKQFFSGFLKGFKDFGHIITNIVNFILLSIVYFVGIGPTSIVAKISGKHFLDLKKKKTDSYYTKKDIKKEPIENYYRQF